LDGPLKGLRVADFSQLVQGPAATQFLADMGADVIKIEPRGGEWQRHWSLYDLYLNGESLSFLAFNRGKLSITLNLKDPRGREIALRIIKSSDVLVENFRPGVMERLGLGYDTLKKVHPKLIYCASTGWGQDGPYKDRPGQDLLAQAVSGVLMLNGKPDDPPTPFGLGIADLTAARHIAMAILTALYGLQKTGNGTRVEVNLLDSMMSLATQELTVYLNTRIEPQRSATGIGHPYAGAPLGIYKTKDGYIAVAMMPVCKIAELVGVEGFAGSDSRNVIENRDAVKGQLDSGFLNRTTAELMRIFLEDDIWAAPVNTFPDVESDPQVKHNHILVEFDHPMAGKFRTIGPPLKFSGTQWNTQRPPLLGEHTADILAGLGYLESEIEELKMEQVT